MFLCYFQEISIECFEKSRRGKQILPIRGVSPYLLERNNDESFTRRSWIVDLKANQWESSTKQGLPGEFSIIYCESSEMAKIRQPLVYDTPLRLWYPPTHLSANEVTRESNTLSLLEKSLLPLVKTPFISETTSPTSNLHRVHASHAHVTKTVKSKSTGLQHLRKGTKSPPKGSISETKKSSSALRAAVGSINRTNNSNGSIPTPHLYEKLIESASFSLELLPLPPLVLPILMNASSASTVITDASDQPSRNYVNNSGNEKKCR